MFYPPKLLSTVLALLVCLANPSSAAIRIVPKSATAVKLTPAYRPSYLGKLNVQLDRALNLPALTSPSARITADQLLRHLISDQIGSAQEIALPASEIGALRTVVKAVASPGDRLPHIAAQFRTNGRTQAWRMVSDKLDRLQKKLRPNSAKGGDEMPRSLISAANALDRRLSGANDDPFEVHRILSSLFHNERLQHAVSTRDTLEERVELAAAVTPRERTFYDRMLRGGVIGANAVTEEEFALWMAQFPGEDRATAAEILSRLRIVSPHETQKDLVTLFEEIIMPALKADGFLPENASPARARTLLYKNKDEATGVDFSKIGSHKSGDPIGYFFRLYNLLPNIIFGGTAKFHVDGRPKAKRALVIVDNEIGSGLQSLFYFLTSAERGLFPSYRKIYLATVEASAKAVELFRLLAEGNPAEVAERLTRKVKMNDESVREMMRKGIAKLSGGKIELLPLAIEPPQPLFEGLAERQRSKWTAFLEKYGGGYQFGGAPLGVGGSLGRTILTMVQASNSLPDFLFLPIPGSNPKKYLLRRVEDNTTYEVKLTAKLEGLPPGTRLRRLVRQPKPKGNREKK